MDIDPNTIFTVSNQCRQRLDLGEARTHEKGEGFTNPRYEVKLGAISQV